MEERSKSDFFTCLTCPSHHPPNPRLFCLTTCTYTNEWNVKQLHKAGRRWNRHRNKEGRLRGVCSWAAVSGLPFEAAYTGSRVCAWQSANTCFTHSLGIKVTHSHAHTGSRTHLHTVALGTRKWPRPLNQLRQWQKKQHTFWSQTHTFSHTQQHMPAHTALNLFLQDLCLPLCNRINEPIIGCGFSHGSREIKIIILPPYCI